MRLISKRLIRVSISYISTSYTLLYMIIFLSHLYILTLYIFILFLFVYLLYYSQQCGKSAMSSASPASVARPILRETSTTVLKHLYLFQLHFLHRIRINYKYQF